MSTVRHVSFRGHSILKMQAIERTHRTPYGLARDASRPVSSLKKTCKAHPWSCIDVAEQATDLINPRSNLISGKRMHEASGHLESQKFNDVQNLLSCAAIATVRS